MRNVPEHVDTLTIVVRLRPVQSPPSPDGSSRPHITLGAEDESAWWPLRVRLLVTWHGPRNRCPRDPVDVGCSRTGPGCRWPVSWFVVNLCGSSGEDMAVGRGTAGLEALDVRPISTASQQPDVGAADL